MIAIGNANANRTFEFKIFPPYSKPSPKCDRETREKWIRAKYKDRLFVDHSSRPDSEHVCIPPTR